MDIFNPFEPDKPKKENDNSNFTYIFDKYLLKSPVLEVRKRLQVSLQNAGDKEYAFLDFLTIFSMLDIGQTKESNPETDETNESQNQAMILLNWDMGRGKTTQLKRVIDYCHDSFGYETVAIAHRTKLVQEIAMKLDLGSYKEIRNFKSLSTFLERYPRGIACCINSISVLGGILNILFIDEVEGVLSNLASDALFNKNTKMVESVFNLLVKMVQKTKIVFLADANMDSTTLALLKVANIPLENIVLSECPRVNRDYIFVGSNDIHLKLIYHEIDKGNNIAIACMSRKWADRIDLFLKSKGVEDVLLFTSQTKDVESFLSSTDPNKFQCRVLIFTPIFDSGISIDLPNWFHSMHVFVSNKVGDVTSFIQMSGRVRNPIHSDIYFSGMRTSKSRFRKFNKAIVDYKYSRNSQAIQDILKDVVPEYEPQISRGINYQTFLNEYIFCSLRRGRGWITEFIILNLDAEDRREVYKNTFKKDKLTPNVKDLSIHLNAIYAQGVIDAELIDLMKYISLRRRLSTLPQEYLYMLEKYRLVEFFGELVTFDDHDFIVNDQFQEFTNRCKLFSRIRCICEQKSIGTIFDSEVSLFESRGYFDYSPLSTKAFVLCEIFKCVGLDFSNTETALEVSWTKFDVLLAEEWASKHKPYLAGVGISYPPFSSNLYVRWFNKILQDLGLQTVVQAQTRKNNRIRGYRLQKRSLDYLMKWSIPEYQRLCLKVSE